MEHDQKVPKGLRLNGAKHLSPSTDHYRNYYYFFFPFPQMTGCQGREWTSSGAENMIDTMQTWGYSQRVGGETQEQV